MNRIIKARDLAPGDELAVTTGTYRTVITVHVTPTAVDLTLAGLSRAVIKGPDSPVAIRAAHTVAEHAAMLLDERVTGQHA